ncbi:MAG TPA: PQQ-dependent sugar dehydrogenase, partial [Candidatus Limnocylindria bacterium]|nr:PQQ-dependent sugar dehydrogenase [Candidatus Limnocylindria bacterium]
PRVAFGNPSEEGGILGLAFHPNYSANGFFFVYYLCDTTTADGSGRHNRLSRFTRSKSDPNKADAGSEVILFSQYDEKFNHNGGTIAFGQDGYLYLSLGDEGHPDDMFDNAQRIDKDLFSAVIRIDVDHRAESLRPNPHAALAGKVNYWIPPDNPYVGATSFNGFNVDPTRVRTEFYAVGIRSPWRMFWDLPTATLYLSDVGENSGEEINVITKGGNYGWPYRLANEPGPKADQAPAGFSSTPPLLTYARGESGPFVGRAAIGGVVYRGSRFPELNGAYIFGDYYAGNVWMLRHSGNSVQTWQFLFALPQFHIVSFGVDPRNGDILICDIGGNQIKRLIRTPGSERVPATLAETGAFADLPTLTPSAGVVPYDLNVPFWSDGAIKQRWFAMPDATSKIDARPAHWEFPEGAVFVKHFELELVKGDPGSRRRVETRFLVRNSSGVYGVTYRWNGSQDNATLVPFAGADETFSVNDGGVVRQQTWHYPGGNECLTCHNPIGGLALGLTAPQMNRTFNYGSFSGNQLSALAKAGYFSSKPPASRALAPASDTRASLESRVRSYLEANCAQCHQPGGFGRALWDARMATPLARAGIINGGVSDTMGDAAQRVIAPKSPEHSMILTRMTTLDPSRRMPPLASSVVDIEAMELMTDWINSLPKRTQPLKVHITAPRSSGTTNDVVTVRGVASGDNLAAVVFTVNDSEEQTASGVAEWSVEVPLTVGVNRIAVTAVSNTGQRSRPATKLVKRKG